MKTKRPHLLEDDEAPVPTEAVVDRAEDAVDLPLNVLLIDTNISPRFRGEKYLCQAKI
jgi:hypothetical protein